ncbi:MAG: peptide chain release factor N(5)-glutamine methyltransferase [Nitrospirae bacterium]|nr:MAG: peptide chain release factor N(5)-glutamine methyltransferase [Nitrospirota bacterium]
MRVLEAVRYSLEVLSAAGIDDPPADAEGLVLHCAGLERLTAYTDNPEIGPQLVAKIKKLTGRRARGEPLQYIVGHMTFCGLEIAVGRGVLIPRPETELLVEEAVRTLKQKALTAAPMSILDLCTGSGCIALALALDFPGAEVIGTDLSVKALRYARKNAAANGIRTVAFKKGSLFGPVKKGMRFDLITANPPYICSAEIPGLQREVRDWEPVTALDGGADGLDFYRAILSGAGGYLKPDGALVMELGYGQAAAVTGLARQHGFRAIEVVRDFAGLERIMKARTAET